MTPSKRQNGPGASPAAGADDTSLEQRLAANARRLRDARGWTQEQAAWRSRLAVRMYQSIEGAAANPTLATVSRLCDAFSVDVQELIAPAPKPVVRLPGRPRRVPTDAAPQAGAGMTAPERRGDILVMEPDDAVRIPLESYLHRHGFDVTAAATAEEGLRQLASDHFDLVLCSDALPDHPSAWLLEQVPSERRLHETMLVLSREQAAPDEAVGPQMTLRRPLDLDRLLRAIEAVLRVRAPSDQESEGPTSSARFVELALYVTKSPSSRRAKRNLEHVLGRYDARQFKLIVCDLDVDPRAGEDADRVVFTPTLVKRAPGDRSWLLGDLQDRSAVERMLQDAGLERIR